MIPEMLIYWMFVEEEQERQERERIRDAKCYRC